MAATGFMIKIVRSFFEIKKRVVTHTKITLRAANKREFAVASETSSLVITEEEDSTIKRV